MYTPVDDPERCADLEKLRDLLGPSDMEV